MGSPLFNINILSEEEKKAARAGAVSIQSIIDNAIGKRKQTLDFVFGSLKDNRTVHFSTGAEWSMVELLMYLLEQSGPADVRKERKVFFTLSKISLFKLNQYHVMRR